MCIILKSILAAAGETDNRVARIGADRQERKLLRQVRGEGLDVEWGPRRGRGAVPRSPPRTTT